MAAAPSAPESIRMSRHFDAWLEREPAACRARAVARGNCCAHARRAVHHGTSSSIRSCPTSRRARRIRFSRARAAGRRHGARQDRAGDCRLRVAGAAARHRAGPGGFARLGQGGMGGADRPLHRPGVRYRRRRVPSGCGSIRSRPSSRSSTTSRSSRDADEINRLCGPTS